MRKGTRLIVLAVVALVVASLACNGDGGGTSDTADEIGAFVMCKEFVRDRLKAPRTAKFQSVTQADFDYKGGQTWRVSSWVDAENSFGAMIRTDFVCEIRYEGDDEWRLVDLELFE
jgi:hypothetical protein